MNTKIFRLLSFAVFTMMIVSGCIVIDLNGCGVSPVKGSGDVISEDRQVSSFNKIKLKGSGNVILTSGEQPSVVVKTDENIMPLIETTVRSNQLVISQEKNVRPTILDFYITVEDLKGVSISGSGDVHTKSRFISEDFEAKISGSGDMNLELEANHLESEISGSGSINLTGKTANHEASVSGSGKINAFDMDAETVSVKISGSGDCKITVSDVLNANISGSGDVYYRGRPQLNAKISGSGSVKGQN